MEVCVAVIDDGVSAVTVPDLRFDLELCEPDVLKTSRGEIQPHSHGSICAAIIRKYAPQARIGSIRILKNTGRGSISSLLNALKWCGGHGIRLIHLSAGSIQASDILPLRNIIKEISQKGCIVVAACKNGKNVSFPASFSNVIGVKADERLSGGEYRVNPYPNGGIELSAGAKHEADLCPRCGPYVTPLFNSFAAPVVTAHVFNELRSSECGLTLEEIRTALYTRAGSSARISGSPYSADWYRSHPYTEPRPVVLFAGERLSCLARDIARMLLNDGYFPLLFSRFEKDCSDECFWTGGMSSMEDACQGMAEYCGAELILSVVSQDEPETVKADALIHYGSYGATLVNCKLKLDAGHLSVYGMYKQLMDFLVE